MGNEQESIVSREEVAQQHLADLYDHENATRLSYQAAVAEKDGLSVLTQQETELHEQINMIRQAPAAWRHEIRQMRQAIEQQIESLGEIDQRRASELFAVKNAPIDVSPLVYLTEVARALFNVNKRLQPDTPVLRVALGHQVAVGISDGSEVFASNTGDQLGIAVNQAIIAEEVTTTPYHHNGDFDAPNIEASLNATFGLGLEQLRSAGEEFNPDAPLVDCQLLIGRTDIKAYIQRVVGSLDSAYGWDKLRLEDLLFSAYAALKLAGIDFMFPVSYAELLAERRKKTLDSASMIVRGAVEGMFDHSARIGHPMRKEELRQLGIKCRVLGITEDNIVAEISKQIDEDNEDTDRLASESPSEMSSTPFYGRCDLDMALNFVNYYLFERPPIT
jgi:hypothetical protein